MRTLERVQQKLVIEIWLEFLHKNLVQKAEESSVDVEMFVYMGAAIGYLVSTFKPEMIGYGEGLLHPDYDKSRSKIVKMLEAYPFSKEVVEELLPKEMSLNNVPRLESIIPFTWRGDTNDLPEGRLDISDL